MELETSIRVFVFLTRFLLTLGVNCVANYYINDGYSIPSVSKLEVCENRHLIYGSCPGGWGYSGNCRSGSSCKGTGHPYAGYCWQCTTWNCDGSCAPNIWVEWSAISIPYANNWCLPPSPPPPPPSPYPPPPSPPTSSGQTETCPSDGYCVSTDDRPAATDDGGAFSTPTLCSLLCFPLSSMKRFVFMQVPR